MDAITYTSAKKHLAEIVEKVCNDYRGMEETSYLMKSPENAKRLLESVKELEEGYGTEKELIEWN